MATVRDFRELRVYREAFACAVEIHRLTRALDAPDRDVGTQLRRTSTSVAANIPEAWVKRRYPRSFASVLTVAEAECAEMRFWLQFAATVGCLARPAAQAFEHRYVAIGAQLASMRHHAETWKPKEQS